MIIPVQMNKNIINVSLILGVSMYILCVRLLPITCICTLSGV
jgi:hypothetical protein